MCWRMEVLFNEWYLISLIYNMRLTGTSRHDMLMWKIDGKVPVLQWTILRPGGEDSPGF